MAATGLVSNADARINCVTSSMWDEAPRHLIGCVRRLMLQRIRVMVKIR